MMHETMTRVRAIRKRLEKSNPFSEDRADLEWALSILEDLEEESYSGEPTFDGAGGPD